MVLFEVGMPSGFIIEKDKLSMQLDVPHVKLVETKEGETVAVIYFEHLLPHMEHCVEIQGYRSHKVAENKPVPVRVYDYYDSCKYCQCSQQKIHFYLFHIRIFKFQLKLHKISMKFHQSHLVKFAKLTNAQNYVKSDL